MPEDKKQPDVSSHIPAQHARTPEYRSLTTDIAAVATPVAVVAAPVVAAWANQHFSHKPQDAAPSPPQPQQQPTTD
jgi:hypothetical protein